MAAAPGPAWTFEALPDIFENYGAASYDGHYTSKFNKVATQPRLALLHREYPSDDPAAADQRDWTRLAAHVRSLNAQAPANVRYKVLYLTRHGLGYHNQKHTEVGTQEWEEKWALKDGDGVNTWFDSFLTPAGEQQARDLSKLWETLTTEDNVPFPQSFYTSPMARCLQTTELAFAPLRPPFRATVKEALRERYTLHTCDKRRPRSWVEANWGPKGYLVEREGFPEEDQMQALGRPETEDEHTARKQRALEDIFEADEGEFISLSIHSIAIRAVQAACKAEVFRVREGSSIAMLVKGEKLVNGEKL